MRHLRSLIETLAAAGAILAAAAPAGGMELAFKRAATLTSEPSSFGAAVALDWPYLVVGAPDSGIGGEAGSGAVVVFQYAVPFVLDTDVLFGDYGGEADDAFGSAVAIDGLRVVVGVPGRDGSSTDEGAAYVFEREGADWVPKARLEGGDPTSFDLMGTAVALDGGRVIVGAPDARRFDGSTDYTGAVFVFDGAGSTWTRTAWLAPHDSAAAMDFGASVDVQGSIAVVGAPSYSTGLTRTGSAYVFERSGAVWYPARLVAPEPGLFDDIGASVALDGTTIVVGAPNDSDVVPEGGAAHVFERIAGIWTYRQTLRAPAATATDHFGSSISVAGDLIVVGARFREGPAGEPAETEMGEAYVFERGLTRWLRVATLSPYDGSWYDHYGTSVFATGINVVVGAPDKDEGIPDGRVGAAYVYEGLATIFLDGFDDESTDAWSEVVP